MHARQDRPRAHLFHQPIAGPATRQKADATDTRRKMLHALDETGDWRPGVVQTVALIKHEDQWCVPKALSEFDKAEVYPPAHNVLVAGSSPAGPTTLRPYGLRVARPRGA
jgi:hypothetical protein